MTEEPIVADFMDHKFNTLSPNTSINKAIDLLMKKRLIAVIVVNDQNKPIGLLSERDCLKMILHQAYSQLPDDTVKHYMQKISDPISKTMPASEAATLFINNKFRRLPVVEDGKLVGQITRRDLLRGLHRRLFPRK